MNDWKVYYEGYTKSAMMCEWEQSTGERVYDGEMGLISSELLHYIAHLEYSVLMKDYIIRLMKNKEKIS